MKHPDRLRLLTWREQWGGWVAPNLGYLSPAFGTIYEQRETPDGGLMHTDFTPRIYREFLRYNTVFESLFGFKELGRATAVVDGNAEPVNCFLVSGDFYHGMELSTVIGRAIRPEDDVSTTAGSVAVINYQYWTSRFSRSSSVIGKTITLNQVPVTIIGVNPEYFTGIEPGAAFEIWAPLHLPPAVYGNLQHGPDFKAQSERSFLEEEKAWALPIMGRLKPGVSDSRAQSELDALFQPQVDANPGPLSSFLKDPAKRPRLILQSGARGVDYLTDRYDRMLLALLALSALVLLIACANVANLLLAKSAVRRREISLRLALGAGRGRIARQLLAEGLLLASIAGVVGVVLGYWTRNGIPALLATPWRPSPFDTAFDPKVLLVSVGITLTTGLLFSLAPMWQARRVEVHDALKEGTRGAAGLSKLRIGRLLVALQVALSVLLLVGAGICVKTFVNLKNVPLGFQPDGLLLFSLDPPRLWDPAESMGVLLTGLQKNLSAIPGVQSAAFSASRAGTAIAGQNQKGDRTFDAYVRVTVVGSHFFQTMGIPILQGRAIEERDSHRNALQAVVVNREFARHFYSDQNPLGQTFKDSGDVTYQIVGVCADWRFEHLRDPIRSAFYSAWIQSSGVGRVDFELKIAGPLAGVVRQIRRVVPSVDSNLAMADVRTGVQQADDALAQERLMASLAVVFGALALVLAIIGIYGVMAYAVARRTSEIGIRMALGARPRAIAWMVLRETLSVAAAGVAVGVGLVLSVSPILDHFLAPGWNKSFTYGTRPNDPLSIAIAALVLAGAAYLAAYFPSRRAANGNPMLALRHE
ncbi:MAG: ADOP family duplicated permease [Acidobacteriia bacterium]|nr:ADOP family duplicated permease [Terriglobia bacterium]